MNRRHYRVPGLSALLFIGTAGAAAAPALMELTNPKGQVSIWMESSLKRIFPKSPPGNTTSRTLHAARNQKVSFQVGIRNSALHSATANLSTTEPEGLSVQIRRVGYVPMRHLTPGTRPEELDGTDYLPGLVPDPLFPEQQLVAGPLESQAFWITVDVATTATPGTYDIPFNVLFVHDKLSTTVTARVHVHEFTIAKRKNFPVTHWWRPSSIYGHYKMKPWNDEWFAMTEKYIRDMVEHGSNVVLVNTLEFRREVFKQPNQMLTIRKEGDRYTFDYSVVRRFVQMAKQAGMEYFEWPHLWIYWGVKNPMVVYKESGELYFPLDSDGFAPEYIEFLRQYLASLHAFLTEEGILEKSFFHLSDEPDTGEHYERYRKARGILKEIAPWMKVMDALSHIDYGKNGVTDIPVPLIVTAKSFKEAGIRHWAYYCCAPTGDYLNRFMDTPLAKVRMSGMLFYRLGAEGFLHWGYNYWDKIEKDQLLDVYCQGDAGAWPMIPYGDPFVVYPGPDGPVSSTRWEIFAESLQDYAMLQTAGISPDDPLLREIEDYHRFPKSESWILETVQKVLKQKTGF